MPIVTLISDLGTKDYYAAAVKGAILGECPGAVLIDITHQIPPFDIFQASFNLKNAYPAFPPGTVHLVGVEPAVTSGNPHLAALYDSHYFVGADNGIFSLIFDHAPEKIVRIEIQAQPGEENFPLRGVLAKAAGFLAKGGSIEALGPGIENYSVRATFQPVVTGNEIRGAVMYVDSFGNVFTNIERSLFNSVGKNRPFSIFFAAANYPIRKISTSYSDVIEGEKLALFASSGHLQIAINKGVQGSGGGASQLFGLKLNQSVRIEFEEKHNV